jgi:uncharacterized membrane protein YeiH
MHLVGRRHDVFRSLPPGLDRHYGLLQSRRLKVGVVSLSLLCTPRAAVHVPAAIGHHGPARPRNPVLWFDAIGLAFFAVAGAQKALVYGLDPGGRACLRKSSS